MTVHGGPTGQASRTPSAQTAYLTSRGIGVVALDYGGSTGYGRAYRERLNGAWGVVDVQDAATVAAALVADGTASPAGLVIEGGSAGGWTVLSALTTPGNPFAAGISLFGVADARALADGTHDFESRYTDSLLGPDPDRWYEMSPLARADLLDTPVLLLQGGRDPIVTPDQAEAFRRVCADRGVRHALVIFPEESHGFRAAEAQIATLEAELSFMGQILGFDTPDVPHLSSADAVPVGLRPDLAATRFAVVARLPRPMIHSRGPAGQASPRDFIRSECPCCRRRNNAAMPDRSPDPLTISSASRSRSAATYWAWVIASPSSRRPHSASGPASRGSASHALRTSRTANAECPVSPSTSNTRSRV